MDVGGSTEAAEVSCAGTRRGTARHRRGADRLHPRAGRTRKAPSSHEPGGSAALPCPAPTRAPSQGGERHGRKSVLVPGLRRPGRSERPGGSGRGLRQALVSLSGFGKRALRGSGGPGPGPERGRGIPSRRLPGRASARGGAASPSAPLPPRRRSAGSGAGPGQRRSRAEALREPGIGGRDRRARCRQAMAWGAGGGGGGSGPSAPGGADPALRNRRALSAQGLPSSSAAVPGAAPAVLTTRPAVEQSGNCVYSGKKKGKKQNTKKFNELSQMVTSTGFQFPRWWQCNKTKYSDHKICFESRNM